MRREPLRNGIRTDEVRPTRARAATPPPLGLGWATVAALGGIIIGQWGFHSLFALAAVFALVNAGILTLYLRHSPWTVAAEDTHV